MVLSRSYNDVTSSGMSEADDCLHEANSTDMNKDHITSNLSDDKDVDGGWAWLVLAAATSLFCVFGSTMKCFGIFFNSFVEEFGASSFITALITGILQGTYSTFTLPVLTIGLRYFTTRQFAILAGILSSGAFIVGSFADTVQILLVTNGVMMGVAFACVHGPLMYLNGLYFVKRLSLAQAITVSGFSFGGFIFPPFYSYIIEYYGIRGGMLITGGLLLHVILLSMFLKPKNSKASINTNNRAVNNSASKEVEKPLQTIKKEQLKYDSTPLIYYERERCHSESLPSYYPINHNNGGIKIHAVSELHLHQQELSGSMNKFIDKLSHSNITRVIGESDVISMSLSELRDNRLRSCDSIDTESPSGCSQRFKYIFDGSVFKHWFTWLYLFVYCIGSIGSAYVIVFIAPFAKDHNISPNRVASLVSIVNACDFVGRLMNGVITDRKILKNHQSVIITLCVTTVCLALSPLYTQYWHFVVFAIVSGLSSGGIFAMTPSVLVDFIGIENFRSAMGIMVLGQGLTLGLSAPFIGLLRDVTGTYITSFSFMAGCEFLSVFILTVGLLVKRKLV